MHDHSQNAPQSASAGRQCVKVISHPRFPGFWAILIDGSLYGKFERRALAVAYAVTRV